MNAKPFTGANLCLALGLVVLVVVVYWESPDADFLVHHDDNVYVTDNPLVKEGLSSDSVVKAFTETHGANWHPLTWISHQIDVENFGLDPRGHHVINILFHGLNTVLLFLLLSRMTGASLRSAFVAALFAAHPLHVESVAWVAERKDLLSTFFFLLTIWAYIQYARCLGLRRYLVVALFFCLGLLSKPMVVTLPFVLLLIDFWPLERLGSGVSSLRRIIIEKIPLITLSAASCIVTVLAQTEGGAMRSLPLGDRLSNALVAYVQYILKMFWPSPLAAQYPHPEGTLPLWQIVAAAVCLIGLTALAVVLGKRVRYIPAGWFWYLGTLVPVIGIVQVGHQAMADRYTYIPLIGLFVIAAWGAHDLAARWIASPRMRKAVLGGVAGIAVIAASVAAHLQVSYWKNSPTLFGHALEVTEDNYLMEHDLGMALVLTGKVDEGIAHLMRAVAIRPDFGVTYANLAMIHHARGYHAEAWKYVHLARKYACELSESFVSKLETSMPDPGEDPGQER